MADSTHIRPPPPLVTTENQIDNWKLFKQTWENYSVITKLTDKDEAYKKAMFLHCIGTDALKIVNTLTLSDQENKLEHIISKLEAYLIGEVNETYERYVFNQRAQKEGESVDSFITSLKTLAKSCNFCDCLSESLLRDKIVLGIRSATTRKKLIQERKLTLKKCIDICRSDETSSSHLKAMDGQQELAVNKLTRKKSHFNSSKSKYSPHSQKTTNNSKPSFSRKPETSTLTPRACKFCAQRHPLRKELCPAYGQTCKSCQMKNHFAVRCPTKRTHLLQYYSSEEEEDLLSLTNSKKKAIFINLKLGSKVIRFQVDSGATANVIPKSLLPDNCNLKPASTKLRTYNDQIVHAIGKVTTTITNSLNGNSYSVDFLVVESDLTPILGKSTSEKIGVISVNYNDFEHVNKLNTSTADSIVEKNFDIFNKSTGCFSSPVHISLDSSKTPVNLRAARLPVTLKSKVKTELDRLVQENIISPVTEPTDWCSRMVCATKRSGELRICLDPRELNKALKRETYQIPTMDEILPELASAKCFSKLDVKSAFWHCQLDDESSLLTTFETPFGRYKWNRLPFGLSVSGEIFQRLLNEALSGLKGVVCGIDDIIVFGKGATQDEALKDHNVNLLNLLERCRQKDIALNKDKLELCCREIKFLGHRITSEGLEPDPEKIKAVRNMTQPTDVKGVQRLCGFVNYLAKFLPNLSDVMEPIRCLTRTDSNFHWGKAQDSAFLKIKQLVTQAPVLAFYQTDKPLTLQCDASEKGMGAALLQCDKPIAYASRALTETEQRYAQIEKEMLAIVFALQRFHQYTFGKPVTVQSDHKPLEAIIKKPLSSVPRRLQGMLLRIQPYDLTLVYKKGTEMYLADTLSRAFLPDTDGQEEFEQVNTVQELAIRPERLRKIQLATNNDSDLSQLKQYILTGWPHQRSEIPTILQPYYNFKHELNTHDDLIFKGNQVVVPKAMRLEMKQALHSSHKGIDACLRRARESLFWPSMTSELRQYVSSCTSCQKFAPRNQKETLISHDVPSFTWEKVGVDLFEFSGHNYLVLCDYLTSFYEVEKLTDTTADTIVKRLKYHFARYGIPCIVVSDNGPQFTSLTFKQFAQQYEFTHSRSSPYHSQSNGLAESAVKRAKTILRKCHDSGSDPFLALLEARNTPDQTNISPAQKFFNRRTRTLIPISKQQLKQKPVSNQQLRVRKNTSQKKQKQYYDRHAKDLPSFQPGDRVMVQPTKIGEKAWKPGLVTEAMDKRRYCVETPQGRITRNRIHLRNGQQTPSFEDCPPIVFTPETATPTEPDQSQHQPPSPSKIPVRTTRSGREVKTPDRYKTD